MKITHKYTVDEWRDRYPSDKTVVGDLDMDAASNRWYSAHIDGTYFSYFSDAKKYVELRKRQLAGEISDLYLSSNIEICPTFENNGEKYKGIHLKVEFTYRDAEGKMHMVVRTRYQKSTSSWWTKVKMYLAYNPDVILEQY